MAKKDLSEEINLWPDDYPDPEKIKLRNKIVRIILLLLAILSLVSIGGFIGFNLGYSRVEKDPNHSNITVAEKSTATVAPTPTLSISDFTSENDPLVAYWNFDNCNADDSSGNQYHGVIHGDTNCVDGISGKALQFNGVNTWVSLEPTIWQKRPYEDFSLAFWFKPNSDSMSTLFQAHDGTRDGLTGFNLTYQQNQDNILRAWFRAEGPLKCQMSIRYSFAKSQWYHLVMIRKTNWKAGYFYINGEQIGRCYDPDHKLIIHPQSYLRIGYGYYLPDNYETYFDGFIDEVHMYNQALTEEQVVNLYRYGD